MDKKKFGINVVNGFSRHRIQRNTLSGLTRVLEQKPSYVRVTPVGLSLVKWPS